MRASRMLWTLLCFSLATFTLHGAELGIGDAAPKLDVAKFYKGDPVTKFEAGQVYVVEFWATWCGPCRATIPHLSALQKKYGNKVVFIGVSVWERDASRIEPFLKSMGDKMEYRVAADNVGKDDDASEGPMAKNWMTAAGQEGIPAAFIIDGDGKVAWIGHPGRIDQPLADVVAGKFDLAKAKKSFVLMKKLRGSKDPAAQLQLIDEALKEFPALDQDVGMIKFTLMAASKETKSDETLKYGEKLLNEVCKDNAEQLNELAWVLVDPERATKPSKAEADFAVRAAQRGVELTKEQEHPILDTLACAYYAAGDKAKAIEYIEKALKIHKDPEYQGRLEMFKK
jgi:thiol-disulfide isomerase/thioredoxin